MSGSVFMPTSISPSPSEPDATKHVNYVLGMVLGVDDFTQEFAYLAGRTELAARELAGSGVTRGLRVTSPTSTPYDDVGPEVVVSAGIAVTPRGRFVRVPLTQCVFVNEWIAKNLTLLQTRLAGVPGPVAVYVVLSYAEQTTDLVPIPGEPCRTEDESMAASRVTDDFKLELRLDRPQQSEAEATRAYLDWLIGLPLVAGNGTPLRDFLAAIERAASGTPKVAIAPSTTPIFTATPAPVLIPRSDAAGYLREAIRLFATLRAEWTDAGVAPPTDGVVLLGRVDLVLKQASLTSSTWVVNTLTIDETDRPRVLSLAALQEVMFTLAGSAARSTVTFTPTPTITRYFTAAAGVVKVKDAADTSIDATTYNGLTAWASNDGEVTVRFDGPSNTALGYVVKVLPTAGTTAVFASPTVAFGAFTTLQAGDGSRFTLLVKNAGNPVSKVDLVDKTLMIEVSAFGNG